MNKNSSLRELLKTRTMVAHEKIETNPVLTGLMAPTLTREDYVRVLKRYLGFFRPLERALESITSLRVLIPDFKERRRTPALVADLGVMGLNKAEIAEIVDCADLPALFGDHELPSELENRGTLSITSARFLGINYVLEGSTLGGSMMAKKLSAHAFLSAESLNFLSGHCEKTGQYWQRFIHELESIDTRNKEQLLETDYLRWRQSAAEAASQTFDKMDIWMDQV